jgi:hypothetical protein
VVKRKVNRLFDGIEEWAALEGRARQEAVPGLWDLVDDASRDWHLRLPVALLGAFALYHRALTSNDVRYAAVQVHIGLTLYKAEHGRYPDALDEIQPYLGKMPLDPYTQKPFRYRREGDKYVFYSFGPNLVDDGGVDLRGGKTRVGCPTRGNGIVLVAGQKSQDVDTEMKMDDQVFASELAPPPPFEEYLKHKGWRPEEGWSTEREPEGD